MNTPWRKQRLGDLCEVTSSRRTYAKDHVTEGIPFYRSKEIIEKYNGQQTFTTELFITEEWYDEIKTKFGVPAVGDVLLTSRGSLGVPYVVSDTKPFYFADGNLTWFRKLSGLDSGFLFYWFLSSQGIAELKKCTIGSSQQAYTIVLLKEMDILLPPLPTQRKIASILSGYDELIESNTRRIAILETVAQAIYREWFVEFRFPGHEKVTFVNSPLGKIPEGWKYQSLDTVADVNDQSIQKGKEPEEVNYVDIASVSTGQIDEVRLLPFSEAPGRARRIVRHGDIIWSTVRPNRKSYSLVLNPLPNMIASTGFAVITGTKAPYTYLYQALTTDDFVGYLVNHARGSAYPAVVSSDFEKANILVPDANRLAAFHQVTSDMFLLKHQLQQKNRCLRSTRDLLLPKLISGKVDVEDLDIDTGEVVTE